MQNEIREKLRYDRRLIRRREWVPEAELEAALSELPDTAEKAEWVDAPGQREEGPAGDLAADAGDPGSLA